MTQPIRHGLVGAPHLVDPSGVVGVWFTEPPGAVIQFLQPARGTVTLARFLAETAYAELLQRFTERERFTFILDLTLMAERDPAARPLLVEATKALAQRIERSILVPPRNANVVYLASLKASASLLRVFGVNVVVQPSISAALGFAGLRAMMR